MPAGMESYWEFRAVMNDTTEDDLADCARVLLDGYRDEWEWTRNGMWIFLTPVGVRIPSQGWKLHVSATSRSAGDVLAAVMPVLIGERVQFKFAAARKQVVSLNTLNTPRGSAGKFITIYPADDTQAVRVAQACDRAAEGLTGPAILSDRPIRPGSLVHYRYGAFYETLVFQDDGARVSAILDPDGNPVPDERNAWFSPPAWATNPFIQATSVRDGECPRPRRNPGGRVLLNERYVVRQALKHANKGGVYLAEDRTTGETVVIKEARAHVEAPSGLTGDVAGSLRHEARMLSLVEHLRRTPRLLEVFEQQGHLFFALEYLEGSVLSEYMARHVAETGQGLPAEDLEVKIRQLAVTMQAFHDADVLLRDFTSNNLMVLPDGKLRAIDFQLTHLLSDGPPPGWSGGTPGFASPEQMVGQPSGLPDDYYSLGATIAHVATGVVPHLPFDQGQPRPLGGRLRDWITGAERDGLVAGRICDLVLGCMADDPADRWGPEQVLDALELTGRSKCAHVPTPVSTGDLGRVVQDIGRWLVRTVEPDGDRLWPTSCFALKRDPCNTETGASGVGLFLCQAIRAGGDPALGDLLATAARWVSDSIAATPRRPPGLHSGLSGAAWFLAEAAGCLADPFLLDRASELALAIPASSVDPNLTNGTAGIGLGQLHQWAITGDARFLERADLAAQGLLATAQPGPRGVRWPLTKDEPPEAANLMSYSFTHGIAGITYFLLCAATALGDTRCRDLALEGVETLVGAASFRDGTATWETDVGAHQWWNGVSGIGTVLIRAYAVTGDERYLHMAELAAETVMRMKWRSGITQRHGLAGDAEFLIDLHDLTGQPRFCDLAMELAREIYLRHVVHDGLVVFPDDSGFEVTASFSTGVTGIGSFLLRLVHGGSRSLLLDELLLQPAKAATP